MLLGWLAPFISPGLNATGPTVAWHLGVSLRRAWGIQTRREISRTLHRLREVLTTQVSRASDAKASVSIKARDAVLVSQLVWQRLD